MLCDSFGRIHNYLRISLTDSCNFRCMYCMPDEARSCMNYGQLMTPGEIETIAGEFVKLGVSKIRLTGGEPLVRKDFPEICERLARYPVSLALTTNGALLHNHISLFRQTGIESINVSLDSLKPATFSKITGRDQFRRVWDNIMLLLSENIRVKINVVAMKEVIESELSDFIDITKDLPLHIRFIEFMPFRNNGWSSGKVITAQQMLQSVNDKYDLVKLRDEPHATAKKYKVIGHEGTIAFITTMSNQFCGECNRIRLTADGKMKNCLFGKEEFDLLGTLRKGMPVLPLILQSLENKHKVMGGLFSKGYECADAGAVPERSMVSIGG